MKTTTVGSYHTVLNGAHEPAIPAWALDAIRHAKEHIMVSDWPHGESAATDAEWNSVFNLLGYLLDPNHDDGWEDVTHLVKRSLPRHDFPKSSVSGER